MTDLSALSEKARANQLADIIERDGLLAVAESKDDALEVLIVLALRKLAELL